MLVVTKADLGADRAARAGATCARRCARSARADAGASPSPRSRRPRASTRSSTRSTRTAPALDLAAARTRARRLGALADFVAEHGERGLRALGGRRAAVRWLEEQDAALAQAALVEALERRAGLGPRPSSAAPWPSVRVRLAATAWLVQGKRVAGFAVACWQRRPNRPPGDAIPTLPDFMVNVASAVRGPIRPTLPCNPSPALPSQAVTAPKREPTATAPPPDHEIAAGQRSA